MEHIFSSETVNDELILECLIGQYIPDSVSAAPLGGTGCKCLSDSNVQWSNEVAGRMFAFEVAMMGHLLLVVSTLFPDWHLGVFLSGKKRVPSVPRYARRDGRPTAKRERHTLIYGWDVMHLFNRVDRRFICSVRRSEANAHNAWARAACKLPRA